MAKRSEGRSTGVEGEIGAVAADGGVATLQRPADGRSRCQEQGHSYSSPDPSDFSSSELRAKTLSDKHLQRSEGYLRVLLDSSDKGTRVVDFFQKSPLRMMFPTVHEATREAVLVNTAGGIAGGDQLEIEAAAMTNASIVITSQAAEKVYRALDQPACISTKLTVRDTARLAWLPQETITFNHGQFNRKTEIECSSGAELLALEWLVLGRTAHGEEMAAGQITDSWRLKKDGRLTWADTFRVTTEVFPQLRRKALLAKCKSIGTMIYFGPYLDSRMTLLTEIVGSLKCHCAVTLVGEAIVVRFAAEEAWEMRCALRNLLRQANGELGPLFRVPKMWSC